MKHYDAIIIGAGQAGVPLSKKLAREGKKTILIEKRWVGGTCLNDGCTPTKTMIASARAAYLAERCPNLGVHVSGYSVDMSEVKKRKDDIVLNARKGSTESLQETRNLDLVFGEASFIGYKQVEVSMPNGDKLTLEGDLIFINTGADTVIPDIAGLKDVDYLTSTSILDLEEVPEHLVILGGNYIGLEFGQMFKRFGSKVTILEKEPRILYREDEDVAENIRENLESEAIKILTGGDLQQVKKSDGKLQLIYDRGGKKHQLTGTHLLVAVGRKPQTKTLNLKKTKVATDKAGYIKVNSKLETNQKGIYALGDVKGGPAFTHIAYNDYTIVYRNLVKQENLSIKNRPVPYCMFTDPQMARVGMTETEAREKGLNIKVACIPMERVARAVETGETRGMMKAVVDAKTKKILGVTIIGEQGGEIMSVLQMAMAGNIDYEKIRYFVFAHPTYSESLNNLFMPLTD